MADGTVKKGKLIELFEDSVTVGSTGGAPGVVRLDAVTSADAREWNDTGTAILVGGGVLLGAMIVAGLASDLNSPLSN
jgi:hypothetical protein